MPYRGVPSCVERSPSRSRYGQTGIRCKIMALWTGSALAKLLSVFYQQLPQYL